MKSHNEEIQFISQLWHSGDLADAELAKTLAAHCEEPTAFAEDAIAIALFSEKRVHIALEYLREWATWCDLSQPLFSPHHRVSFSSLTELVNFILQLGGDYICRKTLIMSILRASNGRQGIELAFDDDGSTWIPEQILLPILQKRCMSNGGLFINITAKRMPALFCQLHGVERLSFATTSLIEVFPPEICQLNTLDTISIPLHVKALPPEIQHIRTLKTCDLQIGDTTHDVQNLGYLKYIKNLRLTNMQNDNHHSRLPNTLSELPMPSFCNISSRKPITNWQALTHWTTMPTLSLFFSEPTQLPKEIAVFTELTHFNLSNIYFKRMPLWVGKLKRLESFSINRNKPMSVFPPSVFKLRLLHKLVITECNISKLPDLWNRLPNIRDLMLSNNIISQLPASFAKLRKLSYLALDHNNFKKIPTVLRELPEGIRLDLSHNFLTEWQPLLDLMHFAHIKLHNAFINNETCEEFKQYIAQHLTKQQQRVFSFEAFF